MIFQSAASQPINRTRLVSLVMVRENMKAKSRPPLPQGPGFAKSSRIFDVTRLSFRSVFAPAKCDTAKKSRPEGQRSQASRLGNCRDGNWGIRSRIVKRL